MTRCFLSRPPGGRRAARGLWEGHGRGVRVSGLCESRPRSGTLRVGTYSLQLGYTASPWRPASWRPGKGSVASKWYLLEGPETPRRGGPGTPDEADGVPSARLAGSGCFGPFPGRGVGVTKGKLSHGLHRGGWNCRFTEERRGTAEAPSRPRWLFLRGSWRPRSNVSVSSS